MVVDAWRLWAEDARRCLRYERSKATSFGHAVQRWLIGQVRRMSRLMRLGLKDWLALQTAEARCAEAALFFQQHGPGIVAPWHLPEHWTRLPLAQLPAHPLVDGRWLHEQRPQGPPLMATAALDELLSGRRWGERWQSLTMPSKGALAERPRIAICLHLFYTETWPSVLASLQHIPEPWDLFVTVPAFAASSALQDIREAVPQVRFFPTENRGRDVRPWLRLHLQGAFEGYDLVCKIHTKRSPHRDDGDQWRQHLLSGLLGTAERIAALLTALRSDPTIGLAGPSEALIAGNDHRWQGSCGAALLKLRTILGWSQNDERKPFFAGTMFWFRPAALKEFTHHPEILDHFPEEMGQTDGTLAHAIERLAGACADASGYRTICLTGGREAAFLVHPLPMNR